MQADITAWQLASGEVVEILNLIDDHSRLFLSSEAYGRVKAADVVASFHRTAELHGLPASLLSDNGAVFTAGPRGGKVLLESDAAGLQRSGQGDGPQRILGGALSRAPRTGSTRRARSACAT